MLYSKHWASNKSCVRRDRKLVDWTPTTKVLRLGDEHTNPYYVLAYFFRHILYYVVTEVAQEYMDEVATSRLIKRSVACGLWCLVHSRRDIRSSRLLQSGSHECSCGLRKMPLYPRVVRTPIENRGCRCVGMSCCAKPCGAIQ